MAFVGSARLMSASRLPGFRSATALRGRAVIVDGHANRCPASNRLPESRLDVLRMALSTLSAGEMIAAFAAENGLATLVEPGPAGRFSAVATSR